MDYSKISETCLFNQYVEITQEALIVSKNPSIQKSMLYKKKGGKGWFNMNRCLKITRFACPATQAPLLHCTTTRVMIMTTATSTTTTHYQMRHTAYKMT